MVINTLIMQRIKMRDAFSQNLTMQWRGLTNVANPESKQKVNDYLAFLYHWQKNYLQKPFAPSSFGEGLNWDICTYAKNVTGFDLGEVLTKDQEKPRQKL